MRKKHFIPAVFATVLLTCFAFIGDHNSVQKSDGGPPYNTNAPGEKTCSGTEGTNACHSGGIPDNSGLGTPSILFSGGSTYVPGQTYTVTPTISHPNRNRFGFQIVSLKDSNNKFVGILNRLDTAKTRMQQPTWGSYQDRIFMMHRLAGTYPTTPNLGQWSYEWTAPSYNAGNISFYACFLAANNNNTNDSGDETYWAKITINPSAVGIVQNKNDLSISVYPNPVSEYVVLDYHLSGTSILKAELIDMQGRVVQTLITGEEVSGSFSRHVSLDADLAKGNYFVRSDIDGKVYLKKVVIR